MEIKQKICVYILLLMPFFGLTQVSLNAGLSKAVNIRYKDQPIGSGLYYMSDSLFFLVTAAHVLFEFDTIHDRVTNKLKFNSIDLVSYDKIQSSDNSTILNVRFVKDNKLRKHDIKDICVIALGKLTNFKDPDNVSINTFSNITIKRKSPKIESFSADKSIYLEKLKQGNEVRIIGYPTSLNHPNKSGMKVYEFEFPLIQSGIISGISTQLGNIIISGAVFYGNSGGAVLTKSEKSEFDDKNHLYLIENWDLIGIATELIPYKLRGSNDYSNSGYSVVIPIQYADEIIKDLK